MHIDLSATHLVQSSRRNGWCVFCCEFQMSFVQYKPTIEVGDTVIIFLSVSSVYAIVVTDDGVFQTKYGAIKHADMVGTRYGSTVKCGGKGGWAHVLYPTPELWTRTLPHRTQILYSTDIALVVLQLDLRPGSVVCEAGTGSGSLSHALITAVAPTGRVHTFDFHEERVRRCRDEFDAHGIGHLVTCERRDVVVDGFGLTNAADAVFLDLPVPWDVIGAAKRALKHEGGRICSFSPCIEQVQRVCDVLRRTGFTDIMTVECIQRPLQVRSVTMPVLTIRGSSSVVTPTLNPTSTKVPLSAKPEDDEQNEKEEDGKSVDVTTNSPKRHCGRRLPVVTGAHPVRCGRCPAGAETTTFAEALPPLQTVGHTGYLTFASLGPRNTDVVEDDDDEDIDNKNDV